MTKQTRFLAKPWKLRGDVIVDSDGSIVVVDSRHKRHIIHCVNNHDKLVAALEYVRECGLTGYIGQNLVVELLPLLFSSVERALAAAEGGDHD